MMIVTICFIKGYIHCGVKIRLAFLAKIDWNCNKDDENNLMCKAVNQFLEYISYHGTKAIYRQILLSSQAEACIETVRFLFKLNHPPCRIVGNRRNHRFGVFCTTKVWAIRFKMTFEKPDIRQATKSAPESFHCLMPVQQSCMRWVIIKNNVSIRSLVESRIIYSLTHSNYQSISLPSKKRIQLLTGHGYLILTDAGPN